MVILHLLYGINRVHGNRIVAMRGSLTRRGGVPLVGRRTRFDQLRRSRRRPAAGWLSLLADTLLLWQARSEQRRRLAACDDAMLKDLGLSRADIERETRKPFWQP